MYRKHLREMESKTGIKTIDRLTEIPVVNSAIANLNDYYGKVKERNILWRTSCNLAELSFKTMALAAVPLATLCKKPSIFENILNSALKVIGIIINYIFLILF